MTRFPRFLTLAGSIFVFSSAFAATEMTITQTKVEEKVPVDIFEFEAGYVFESDLNHGGGSFGKQYELQSEFEYGHRFLLNGNWYLHAGLFYDRFDFENTDAPVPVHLQRMGGVIGLEYMQGEEMGAFLQFRPGFFTEEHIGISSFDCPILIGRFWVLQPQKLYLMTGVYAAFLRGQYPVLPLVGVVWIPTEKVRVMGVLPEPRVIYSVSKELDLWAGAELVGGAFRTDHDKDLVGPNAELSGTQVDYDDYRAGLGLTFSPSKNIDLDLAGGCSIQRSFNFNRAEEHYRTDPAPYVRFEIKAKF